MHGDISTYATLVKLAQSFNNYPLIIKPHGGFGSLRGDSASAMRYTEVYMSQYAYDCYFSEWDESLVDMKETFTKDKDIKEPEFLASRYPTILFKPSFAMSFGVKCSVPSFNVNEAIDKIIDLIKNPKSNDIWLYPDFPQRCAIVEDDFKSIMNKGEGSFRIRGEMEYNKEDNIIVIKSIPFKSTTEKIKNEIIALNKNKVIELANIRDESCGRYAHNQDDVEIVLYPKRGANVKKIMDTIYKSTSMETSYYINFKLTIDYQRNHYNLKSLMLEWIDYRRDMKMRILTYKYKNLSKKLYFLKAYSTLFKDEKKRKRFLDEMQKSKNKQATAQLAIDLFKFTKFQASLIADLRIHQFNLESVKDVLSQIEDLESKTDELNEIIHSPAKLDKLIISELKECKKKYGRDRLCPIIEVKNSKKYDETKVDLIVTKQGYIKKHIHDDNVKLGELLPGDSIFKYILTDNSKNKLVFDEEGKVINLDINNVTQTPYDSVGVAITSSLNISERLVSVMDKSKSKDSYLVFLTKNGMVKKSPKKEYIRCTSSGMKSIQLKDKDKLVGVVEANKNDEVILYTRQGDGIKIKVNELSELGRVTSGVISSKLRKEKDYFVGLAAVSKEHKDYIIVTSKGKIKKCKLSSILTKKRGSETEPLITLKAEEIHEIIPVKKDMSSVFITKPREIKVLNLDDVEYKTRLSQADKF